MQLESSSLSSAMHLRGHGHSHFHICIVRGGGFAERVKEGWQECDAGTVRVSPGHVHHDLRLSAEGLQYAIIELPDFAIAGLGGHLKTSVFLKNDRADVVTSRLLGNWTSGNVFGAECCALELAASAVSCRSESVPPDWLEDLRAELDAHGPGRYSLAETARRYDLHRSHVARTFRQWYGRSPGAQLRAQRAYDAALRLANTDQPLADMAYELGFVDQAHFTRVFRAQFGVPPGQYRNATAADRGTQLPYKTNSAPVLI